MAYAQDYSGNLSLKIPYILIIEFYILKIEFYITIYSYNLYMTYKFLIKDQSIFKKEKKAPPLNYTQTTEPIALPCWTGRGMIMT